MNTDPATTEAISSGLADWGRYITYTSAFAMTIFNFHKISDFVKIFLSISD